MDHIPIFTDSFSLTYYYAFNEDLLGMWLVLLCQGAVWQGLLRYSQRFWRCLLGLAPHPSQKSGTLSPLVCHCPQPVWGKHKGEHGYQVSWDEKLKDNFLRYWGIDALQTKQVNTHSFSLVNPWELVSGGVIISITTARFLRGSVQTWTDNSYSADRIL